MQRKFRLTRSEDFKRVRRFGKSYAHPLLVLVALANEDGKVRVGVAAGRTVGSAVKRNRTKRLMRTAMRPLFSSLASGWDLILIARSGLASASLTQTQGALVTVLRRAKILIPSDAV